MSWNTHAQVRHTRPQTRTFTSWLTAAVLPAIPLFALVFCGSSLFAPAQAILASGEPVANVSDNPFRFDGPTVTLRQLKASQDDARQLARSSNVGNSDDVLLLTEWNYTSGPHHPVSPSN